MVQVITIKIFIKGKLVLIRFCDMGRTCNESNYYVGEHNNELSSPKRKFIL